MRTRSHRSLPHSVVCAGMGLALETAAVWQLGLERLQPSAALHLSASLSLGLAAAFVARQRRWRGPPLAAGAIALALPGIGALGLCAVVLPAWFRRRPLQDDGVLELALPAFGEIIDDAELRASSPIEAVLLHAQSVAERVEAVMALRRMDARRAVPLLRTALLDESEDVRLLAYAILERREKHLRAHIEAARTALTHARARGTSGRAITSALRELAQGHWELVHGGFLSDEVCKTVLAQAIDFARAALTEQPDGSLIVLLARMHLRQGDPHAALRCLEHAEAHGVSHAVSAPLSAEAAFLLRRFDAIPRLLARADAAQLQRPQLDAVVEFWTRGEGR